MTTRILLACLTLAMYWCAPIIAQAQDDNLEPLDYPYTPTATSAWMGGASKLDINTLLEEPSIMAVYVFGFDSAEDAQIAYPDIASYYLIEASMQTERDYREISIGLIGDERLAIYDQTTDLAQSLYSIVRVGSAIQVLWLIGIGGDLPSFASAYLQTIIPSVSRDSLSLVPTVANLPVGWSLLFDEPIDILPQITQVVTPTPKATGIVLPSPTPQSTVAPVVQREENELSLSTIESLEDQLATSEADLESARATIVGLEANSNDASLHPEPIILVVQLDLRGFIAGDDRALDDAECELQSVLDPYLKGEGCQIGFAMISSRSNQLGDGVELSQEVGEFIGETFPRLLPENADGLLYEAIALPGTEPVGESELKLFFYDKCSAISD